MTDVLRTACGEGSSPGERFPASRTVVLASADVALRQRLRQTLIRLRWSVREAGGAAEVLACLDEWQPEALILDHWFPNLEITDLAVQLPLLYPGMDLLRFDGDAVSGAQKSPRRHELQHALRQLSSVTNSTDGRNGSTSSIEPKSSLAAPSLVSKQKVEVLQVGLTSPTLSPGTDRGSVISVPPVPLPEMIGESPSMLELARLIRLVAPRSTAVLIEGETGTGKEVVANALHRLSPRSAKPFVVLNCAAIPEALLEAELFGHARGAFTGAVGARIGRIETAHGGTLFLDEIGEMPLALQAKMLRFLECGELQRVGHNEVTRVDVRVIAATHQPLAERSTEGTFRLDLYHRLAVFPLEVPPLRERREDIPLLVEHVLSRLSKDAPRKPLTEEAIQHLRQHSWPGNVRELAHVLERALILASEDAQIDMPHLRYVRRAAASPVKD